MVGGSRAGSELPDDFDLYGSPASAGNQPGGLAAVNPLEPFPFLNGVSIQPVPSLNQGITDSEDDGSRTPRQQAASSVGSNSSPKSTSYTLASMGYSSENLTTVDDSYYPSSREGTPTFSLADVIGYPPSTPGHSRFTQQSLIDLASSAPSSPNAIRSRAVTPPYYSKVNYTPSRSHHKDPLLGEDWESSFGDVTGGYQNQSIPNGSKKNSLFMTGSEDGNTIGPSANKEGALVDLSGSSMRSDTETDDELDFMGVEWFAKAA